MGSPQATRQAGRMNNDHPNGEAKRSRETQSPSKGRSTQNRSIRNRDHASTSSSSDPKQADELAKIGPWRLGKTLGKGSSGRVKLAKHIKTGKYAAVKIVPKRALIASASRASMNVEGKNAQQKLEKMLIGIEREIVIMKLIEHPNIMSLYDVWETHQDLYLVLEYVEGGELFDYLVSKGRLREEEALHYFQQIIFGVDYCHRFNICHRDLKPENLLLDRHHNIKIADFGMAALEPSNKLLETSCGSPHYASPEIVAGKHYHGSASDTWSAGVVLYALLTGRLPFDDENIRNLLGKVKIGKFSMPQDIAPEAQDLIRRMLTVDPRKRITMPEIIRHPWFNKRAPKKAARLPPPPSPHQIQRPVDSVEEIDHEILQNLQTLWHGADQNEIVQGLLAKESNWEKTFYILLLKYRKRNLENYNEEAPRPSTRSSNAATKHPKQFVASTAHTTMKGKRSTTRQSISSLSGKPSSPRHVRPKRAAVPDIMPGASPSRAAKALAASLTTASHDRAEASAPKPVPQPVRAAPPLPNKHQNKALPAEPIPSILNRPRHSSRAYDKVAVKELPIESPILDRIAAISTLTTGPSQDVDHHLEVATDASPPHRSTSPINVPTVGDDRIQRFFQEVADTLHTMTAVQQRSVTQRMAGPRHSSGVNGEPDDLRRISDVTQFDDAEDDRSTLPQPAFQARCVTPIITRATRDARTVSRDSAASSMMQSRNIARTRTSYHSGNGSRPVSIVGAAVTPMLPPLTLPQRTAYMQRSSAPPTTVSEIAADKLARGTSIRAGSSQDRKSAPGAPLSAHAYHPNTSAISPANASPPSYLGKPVHLTRQKEDRPYAPMRASRTDKENLPHTVQQASRIQWSEDTRKVSAATTADQSVYSTRTTSTSSGKSTNARKDSGKYSWFSSLFKFGPAVYHLKSTGTVLDSKLEAWRILRELDVRLVEEEEYLMRCEAVAVFDDDGNPLRPVNFRVEFGSGANMVERKGSTSRRASFSSRRKSSANSFGIKQSLQEKEDRGNARSNVIKITITQEKGSLPSFKFIFAQLRRAWRLDEPVSAGIRLLPAPEVSRMVL